MKLKKLKTFLQKSTVRMHMNRATIAAIAVATTLGVSSLVVHDEIKASTFSDAFTEEEEQEIAEQMEKSILLYVGDQMTDEDRKILSKNVKDAVSEAMSANIKNKVIVGYTDDQVDQMLKNFHTDISKDFSEFIDIDGLTKDELTDLTNKVVDKSLVQFNADIKKVKSDIDTLKNATKELNKKIDILKEVDTSSLKAKDWEPAVQDIENTIDLVDTTVSSLNKALDVTALEKNLYSIVFRGDGDGYIAKEQVDVSGLSVSQYIDVLTGNDAEFETAINALNDNILALGKKANDQSNKNESLFNDIKLVIESHSQKTKALQDTLSDLNECILKEKAARINDCTNFSNDFTEKVLQINDDFTNLSKAISNGDKAVKESISDQLVKDYQELTKYIANNYKTLSDTQKTYVSDITTKIELFASQMQVSFQSADEKLVSEISTINNSLNQLKGNFDNNDVLTSVQSTIANSEAIIDMTIGQNAQLYSEAERAHYEELSQKIATLNKELSDSCAQKKVDIDSDIENLQKRCNSLQTSLAQKIATAEENINDQMTDVNKTLDDLNKYSQDKDKETYDQIVSLVNDLESSISTSLTENQTSFNATEQSHYNEVAKMLDEIQKSSSAGEEQFNTDLENKKSNLNQSILNSKNVLKQTEEEIRLSEEQSTELLNKNITEINTSLTALSQDIQVQIAELNNMVTAAKQNITTLSGRVSVLEADLSDLHKALDGCNLSYEIDQNFYVSKDSAKAKIGIKTVSLPISDTNKISVNMQTVKHDGSDEFVYEFFDNSGSYATLNGKVFDEITKSNFAPTRTGCVFGGYKNPEGKTVFSCERDGNEYTYKDGELMAGDYTAIWYDYTKPIITKIDSVKVAQNKQTLTVTATDTGFGIAGYYIGKTEPTSDNIKNNKVTFDSSDKETYSKTITEAGHYYIVVIDKDGNIATMETNYVIAE